MTASDMTPSDLVIAIGQFPPPVTGFSYITACVVEVMRGRQEVLSVNIGPDANLAGLAKHLQRIARTARACGMLLSHAVRHRSRTSYVACEGSLGLVYTLAVVVLARGLGYRIILHHHSFNYVDARRRLMVLLLAFGGDLRHAFLCSDMRDRFERTYGRIVQSVIISNAAFVAPSSPEQGTAPAGPLVLGHLSNLTREKGLHLFLDLLRSEVARGRMVRGILAGPVALAEDRLLIEAACAELGPALSYLGPLYGAQKTAFYEDIDVFVFGTTYVNEAQPTVLFEALAAGCKVLSFDRGCIARQVEEDGLVLAKTADFVEGCSGWLEQNHARVRPDRPMTRARYIARHQEAREALSGLLE